VGILICATRQKPCRKRVYRRFTTSVSAEHQTNIHGFFFERRIRFCSVGILAKKPEAWFDSGLSYTIAGLNLVHVLEIFYTIYAGLNSISVFFFFTAN